MWYEEELTENTYFAIKKAVTHFFTITIAILFLAFLGYIVLPEKSFNAIIQNKIVQILILLGTIFSSITEYKSIKRALNQVSFIRKTLSEKANPLPTLKYNALHAQIISDVALKKLDLLKSFSPIPFVIYGFGIYVDKKAILNKSINFIIGNAMLNEVLMYSGFTFLAIYILLITRTYQIYKSKSFDYYWYQVEIIKYEEKS